ncbi:pyruvate dehydrogenase X component [Flagelloscypha sp. PMI_526]|nr:pyruvate dehydrogenase X component [Flagelloscypha sp. PMI_526]
MEVSKQAGLSLGFQLPSSLVLMSSRTFARQLVRSSRRCLHSSSPRHAVTNMEMPAMSPTMTEGGIASWKKKEGEAFSAGDVLLEIETDKATIDVEAQEDGILGKIVLQDGSKNVPVGKIIALLAEEGDDISNLSVPEESTKSSKPKEDATPSSSSSSSETNSTPTPQATTASHSHATPTHSRPLFPSVLRLLQANGVEDASQIKGTGIRGMLTKGDVLAFLGKASSPTGTLKEPVKEPVSPASPSTPKPEPVKPLDGPALRRLIVSNLLRDSVKARATPAPAGPITFDSLVEDYLGRVPPAPAAVLPVPPKPLPVAKQNVDAYFDGLL